MRRVFSSWNRKRNDSPYSTLDSDEGEIRLAELASGNYDDALVIRLHIKTLSSSKVSDCEALSYVWGEDVSPYKALVNGKAVSIKTNLDCALRHLRYKDKSRLLWIDALCINQADILERNSQVQLMGRIYSTARTVVIWLGPADDGDAEAIRKIKVWRKIWDLQFFRALICICKRPWFRRVWVVQELALAQIHPMVYLGSSSLPWDQFHNFIRGTSDGTMGTKWDWVALTGSDLHFEFWKAAQRVLILGRVRSDRKWDGLARQLATTAEFEATDPCDKVYGVLGQNSSSTSLPGVTPDYSRSTQEVFIETLFLLIRDYPVTLYRRLPLHPLRKEHMIPYPSVTGLPSWAMDLTMTSHIPDDGHIYHRPVFLVEYHINWVTYETRSKNLASISRLSSNSTLHTVGVYIGTVVETSQEMLLDSHKDYLLPGSTPISISTLSRLYHDILKPRNVSTKSLLLALCASSEDWWYLDHSFNNAYEQLLTYTESNIPSDTELTPLQSAVMRRLTKTAQNQIVFVTSEGHVGLSYHPDAINGIRSGDVVVGLFGVNLPFILRRNELGSNYQMVNIAYVANHICSHPTLRDCPNGTTEEDVWNNLEQFGFEEYNIV